MPNNVPTNLIVSGPAEDVRSFIKRVDCSKNTSKNSFDFNGVLPMPADLENTVHPAMIKTQEEIDSSKEEFNQDNHNGRTYDSGITKETSDRLVASYGFNNWYEWRLRNWGTKWGAYDAGEWLVEEKDKTAKAYISYSTAWSPATEFFVIASIVFPTLEFITECADEGGGFVCENNFVNGDMIEKEHDWDSDDGIRVRENVGLYSPEDEAVTI